LAQNLGLEYFAKAGIEEKNRKDQRQDDLIDGTKESSNLRIDGNFLLLDYPHFLRSLVFFNRGNFLAEHSDLRNKTHVINAIDL